MARHSHEDILKHWAPPPSHARIAMFVVIVFFHALDENSLNTLVFGILALAFLVFMNQKLSEAERETLLAFADHPERGESVRATLEPQGLVHRLMFWVSGIRTRLVTDENGRKHEIHFYGDRRLSGAGTLFKLSSAGVSFAPYVFVPHETANDAERAAG